MTDFWETKFKEVKTMWGFNPSDSAIFAKDFFLANQVKDILIPGIGYGRNAKIFIDNGINVAGIEISKSAIEMAATESGLNIDIHHGSVTDMPFDDKMFDGIFCYALIHLLNHLERKRFIECCFKQLKPNGYMIFSMVSSKTAMFGKGRLVSKNRYNVAKGLNVYYYDPESAMKEFQSYGLFDIQEIDEPVKHMENEPPMKFIMVKCQKK